MPGRRLLVLAGILIGLAALAASVAPREPAPPGSARSAPPVVPSPTPTAGRQAASPAPSAGPQRVRPESDVPGEPPLRRIDAGRPLQPIAVSVGERVRLEVSNRRLSSVQVGRDGPIETIDPDSPARFDLLFSTPAVREIRLYGPGLSNPRVIGTLEVSPAA